MKRLTLLAALFGLFALTDATRASAPFVGSTNCSTSATAIFPVAPTKVLTISWQAAGSTAGTAPAGTICIGPNTVTTTTGVCLNTVVGLNAYLATAGNANIYSLSDWYLVCTNPADVLQWSYLK